jgi:hypothetical protein
VARGKRGGFAAMSRDKQREIARRGGRAAHQKGTAHKFNSDEARDAGRKGGVSVSRDREHMARIGRAGGRSSRSGSRGSSQAPTEDASQQPAAGEEEPNSSAA